MNPRAGAWLAAAPYALVVGFPVAWLAVGLEVPWDGVGARAVGLLLRSVALAGAAAALAGGIGLGAAMWLAAGQGPLRQAVRAAYLAPLLFPSHAYALTWTAILARDGALRGALEAVTGASLSPYGPGGAAIVLALATAPVVTLFALARLDRVERSVVDAGRVSAPPARVWTGAVLPVVLPSALAGVAVAFCLALVDFGVPAMLQVPVYAMEIQAELAQTGDPRRAATTALPLVVLGGIALVLGLRASRSAPVLGASSVSGALHVLPAPPLLRAWMAIGALGLFTATAGPLAALLVQAGSLRVVWEAATSSAEALGLSVAVALASGLGAVAVALPVLPHARATALLTAGLLPLCVPAPLVGAALVHLGRLPGLGPLVATPGWLVVAHVARLAPFALLALALHRRRDDPVLRDAAAVLAPSRLARWWRVELPLALPAVALAIAAVAALSLSELGATVLVSPPGHGTLSVKLFNLLHYGAGDLAAGLVLVLIGAMAAIWAVAWPVQAWVNR